MSTTSGARHDEPSVGKSEVCFIIRGEGSLAGTLFRPAGDGPFPAVVAVHGGGWRFAPPLAFTHLGPWLAACGYIVFVPRHRSAKPRSPSYPNAVHDVRAAVQYVRANATQLSIDRDRIALLGESSGGHLAALVALGGDVKPFTGTEANGMLENVSTSVKAVATVYGIFDLVAQWQHDQAVRFNDHIVEGFLGKALPVDRRPYFDASPLSYVSSQRKGPAFLIAWGTADDVVEPASQSETFVRALKQAGHFVRTVPVAGAPHYWLSEPLDEAQSFSAFFAHRLRRFFAARL